MAGPRNTAGTYSTLWHVHSVRGLEGQRRIRGRHRATTIPFVTYPIQPEERKVNRVGFSDTAVIMSMGLKSPLQRESLIKLLYSTQSDKYTVLAKKCNEHFWKKTFSYNS